MTIRVSDSARWQLRLTLQNLKKRPGEQHIQLQQEVRALLSNHAQLDGLLSPMEGLAELPYLEVSLEKYRLLFRRVEDTLWLAGIWPPMYSE